MEAVSSRSSLATFRGERRFSSAAVIFGILSKMGFPENLIPQAMTIALSYNPDRIPNVDSIVEILIKMNTPATASQSSRNQRLYQHLPDSSHSTNSSNALSTRLLETSVRSRPHTASAGGGLAIPASQGVAAAASAILGPDSISGQVEVISGTLWKQRHIFGFGIQSAEQVEVRFMILKPFRLERV
jgi:hypothetical protein